MKKLIIISVLFLSVSVKSQNPSKFAATGDPVYYSLEVALLHPERVLFLDLSDAHLKEFPIEIEELTNLIGLDISNNQITNIPKYILAKLDLEELYISENPLVEMKANEFAEN